MAKSANGCGRVTDHGKSNLKTLGLVTDEGVWTRPPLGQVTDHGISISPTRGPAVGWGRVRFNTLLGPLTRVCEVEPCVVGVLTMVS